MSFTALLCAAVLSAGQHAAAAVIRSKHTLKGPFFSSLQNVSTVYNITVSDWKTNITAHDNSTVTATWVNPGNGTVITVNGKPVTVSGLIRGPTPVVSVHPVTASSDIFTLPTVSVSRPRGTIEPIPTVDLVARDEPDDSAEDDTDVDACEEGFCGNVCPAKNADGGGWVTIGSVDCDNIPINTTATESPTATDNAQLQVRDDPPPTPLPDLPEYGIELIRYLGDAQEKLHNENKYLDIHDGSAVGKWYPFGKEKVVAGMTGLFGCTALFIVSEKGVYMAHIFEVPVFKDRTHVRPSTDEKFEKWAFNALIHGNSKVNILDPIEDLIGDVNNPGPLHYTYNPIVHIISPYKTGGIGPLKFADRINLLAKKYRAYFYPPEAPGTAPQVVKAGYKVYKQLIAEQIRNTAGKAMLEFNPLDRYVQVNNELQPQSRWRLFNSGEVIQDQWFHNPSVIENARQGLARRDGSDSEGICPLPSLSDIEASTSTSTSTATDSGSETETSTSSSSLIAESGPVATPASTPTTPPLPNDASAIKGPTCADNKNKNIELDDSMIEALADVCLDHMLPPSTDTMGPQREHVAWSIGKGWGDWYYEAEIKVADDCDGQAQNLMMPMEKHDCRQLLKDNFDKETCKAGGTTQVGCLVFGSWVKSNKE